ncbi:MAG: DNA polymerase III subunit delta [Robiginitomaculum sp.]|nr:DNA polymerase III subunit delta [Robiginitomaculum sp.]
MKFNSAGFGRFINKPDPSVFIILVYGVDSGQVSERVAEVKQAWLNGLEDDFSTTIFTTGQLAKDNCSLVDEMSAYTLTGGSRVIHLKQPDISDNKAVISAFKAFSKNSPPVAKLVIEAGTLPPTNTLRKTIEATNSGAASMACYPDSPQEIIKKCKQALSDAGHSIEPEALDFLVASIPPDRRVLTLELEKLLCFVADKPKTQIQTSDIQSIVSDASDNSLDKLIFACIEGRKTDTDHILLRALASGQNPVMIVRALYRYLHRMHNVMATTKSGVPFSAAMSKLRPPVFIMHRALFTKHCHNWSLAKLEIALNNALETERLLKSSSGVDNSIIGRFILATSSLGR